MFLKYLLFITGWFLHLTYIGGTYLDSYLSTSSAGPRKQPITPRADTTGVNTSIPREKRHGPPSQPWLSQPQRRCLAVGSQTPGLFWSQTMIRSLNSSASAVRERPTPIPQVGLHLWIVARSSRICKLSFAVDKIGLILVYSWPIADPSGAALQLLTDGHDRHEFFMKKKSWLFAEPAQMPGRRRIVVDTRCRQVVYRCADMSRTLRRQCCWNLLFYVQISAAHTPYFFRSAQATTACSTTHTSHHTAWGGIKMKISWSRVMWFPPGT